jgi:hypothetical protein
MKRIEELENLVFEICARHKCIFKDIRLRNKYYGTACLKKSHEKQFYE